MKKTFTKFLAALALLAFFIPSLTMTAEDVTVDFTSLGTQTWSNYTLTSGAVTISTNLGTGSAPTTNNAQYRWNTGNIITISTSNGTLKSIRFTTNSTATYGPQCLSYGGNAITSGGTDYTWTAPSGISSADFTVTSSARLTEIHVTYTTSGGGGGGSSSNTVTYTINSKTSVNVTSGSAPTSSSATYSQTYNTACQMTSGNSMTLTLSGYAGYKIVGLVLSMHSNAPSGTQNKGAGYMSAVAGSTTIASVGSSNSAVTFNNWPGMSNYTNTYTDVTIPLSNSNYVIGDNETVTISINATANSLYCQSFTLTYESASGSNLTASDLAITGDPVALSFDLSNNNDQTIEYTTSSTGEITIEPASPTDYFSYTHTQGVGGGTITVTPLAVTPGAQTITISQDADATYNAGSASFTVSVTKTVTGISGLTSNTAAGTYYVALTNAVVKFVSGNFAYIQDATGAIQLYKSSHGLTAGTVLNETATVSYLLNNGNPRITDISGTTNTTGGNTDPTTVAQGSWNYTFANVLNQYFQITGATITSSNNKYYVSLGGENIQLYKSGSISTLDLTKTYTITGFPTMYNTTKELTIFADPEAEASTGPSITANDVTLVDVATSGSITYSVENPVNNVNLAASVTTGSDWLSIGDPSGANEGTITLTCTGANTNNTDRTATVTLTYEGASDKVVTVTQEKYFAPVESLPFSFDGGKADVANTTGLKQDNLGTDYGSSPKLKFDNSNNTTSVLVLKINERPGTLSFKVKGNPGGNPSVWAGTFYVMTSTNGTTWSELASYNDLPSTATTKTIENIDADVRYFKWMYTKTSGNVALGDIQLTKYVAPTPSITVDPTTVNATVAGGSGSITVTYTAIDTEETPELVWYTTSAASSETTKPDWITSASVNATTLNVDYTISANDGDARTAYVKVYGLDSEANAVLSELITINQAAYVAPSTTYWVQTPLANLTPADVFVIVGTPNSGTNYYSVSNNSNPPAASSIEITNDQGVYKLSSEPATTIQWNISGNATDGYTFYPVGSPTSWLNCKTTADTKNNDCIAIGDGTGTTRNIFNLNEDGYLITDDSYTTRYISYYGTNSEWRGYVNTTNNPAAMTFYKKVTAAVTETTPTISQYTGNDNGWHLIASPVASITPTTDNGFLTNTYDLYYFDQSQATEWVNFKDNEGHTNINPGFDLVSGKGYLYANSADVELSFTGQPYNGNGIVALSYDASATFAGYNLIGNPFNTTAYLANSRDFYRMNDEGSGLIINTNLNGGGNAINAFEGIFVKAEDENDNSVIFQTTDPSLVTSTGNNSSLDITVSQAQTNRGNVIAIDAARIRFGESNKLTKFQLFEGDTKIYFPMEDADYAIVSSDGHGTMPVNFKAKEMGMYTISVETEGIDLSYLHLIDRLTGEDVNLLLDNEYSFIASNNDSEERFILSFTEKGYDAHGNEIFVYQSGNDLIVNGEGELQIFDVMGRMVKNTTINGVEAIAMPQGVYIFRLNENIQKIVVR